MNKKGRPLELNCVLTLKVSEGDMTRLKELAGDSVPERTLARQALQVGLAVFKNDRGEFDRLRVIAEGDKEMQAKLQKIRAAVLANKQRIYYEAVAKVLGVAARSMGRILGAHSPDNSFFVSRKNGRPTGYAPSNWHPDLFSSPVIISDPKAVKALAGIP